MLFKSLLLAACLIGVFAEPPLPLSTYGLPLEERRVLSKYDFKLPDTPITSFKPHEVYGLPNYEVVKIAPVVTKYDFTIKEQPKLAPYPAVKLAPYPAVKVAPYPAPVYGVPEFKTAVPVVSKYDFAIPVEKHTSKYKRETTSSRHVVNVETTKKTLEKPIVTRYSYKIPPPIKHGSNPVEQVDKVVSRRPAYKFVELVYKKPIERVSRNRNRPVTHEQNVGHTNYKSSPVATSCIFKLLVPDKKVVTKKAYREKYVLRGKYRNVKNRVKITAKPYPAPEVKYAPYPASTPVVTKYNFAIKEKPIVKYAPYAPAPIYGAPVVTKYDFAIKQTPKYAPYPAKIEVPQQVYGVPHLKTPVTPVVTKYDFAIKETPKYAPYPQAVYGVPELKTPVVTKYDFAIKETPKYAPYPAKIEIPQPVYGVPHLKTPVVTKYDFAIKETPKYAPYPAKIYGAPAITKYDYKIQEQLKPYPAPEIRIIKPQEVYGVPEYKHVAPVVTKYDFTIKELPKIEKPYPALEIVKSAPYPKPHEVYGVPI